MNLEQLERLKEFTKLLIQIARMRDDQKCTIIIGDRKIECVVAK